MVYSEAGQISLELLKAPSPYPKEVLMCRPDFFTVKDVKNDFMKGQLGHVDLAKAKEEWQTLHDTFSSVGLLVSVLEPTPDLEDMVFTANPVFVALGKNGEKICFLSKMRHPSRQKEVAAHESWFRKWGYKTLKTSDRVTHFEGGGDVLWHPGRRVIWGGIGPRTEASVYPEISKVLDCPVLTLELGTHFYHLDTCFSGIDAETVLIYPKAFSEKGLKLIRSVFKNVIEAPVEEAEKGMVCNAAAFFGTTVVMQKGNPKTKKALEALGKKVVEVDTAEFMKSGGSVFCMKIAFY